MRTPYKKIFQDQNKVVELLKLRSEGYSMERLARYFHCDHTSIMYQLRKRLGETKTKNYTTPNLIKRKNKCNNCSMLLTSEYHIKYPCWENLTHYSQKNIMN